MKTSVSLLRMLAGACFVLLLVYLYFSIIEGTPLMMVVLVGLSGFVGVVVLWALGDAIGLLGDIAINTERQADAAEEQLLGMPLPEPDELIPANSPPKPLTEQYGHGI